ETVVENAIEFYDLFGERSAGIVASFSSHIPNTGRKNFELVKKTISLLEKCQFLPSSIIKESCEIEAQAFGLQLETVLANRYYLRLGEWFSSLPESDLLTK